MKQRKFTKNQLKIIENLIYHLDELDNKPRRLFNSLFEFTEEFIEDEEHKFEILDSLCEFQDVYYNFRNYPQIVEMVLRSQKAVNRSLLSHGNKDTQNALDEGRFSEREWAVKDATEAMAKEIIERLIEENKY